MTGVNLKSLKNVLCEKNNKNQKNKGVLKKSKRKRCNLSKKACQLDDDTKNIKMDHIDSMVKSSMFRFINEKLYTCSSRDASELFKKDPTAFIIYHEGFQRQLKSWPNDPIKWIHEYIMKSINNLKSNYFVADMGCGDARLSTLLKKHFHVYSFDLVAVNNRVTVCDIAKTSLDNSSVDFVVFCLSLMGTNIQEFIFEANRILKSNGLLLIVDVASRFNGEFNEFLKKLLSYGFQKEFAETTKDTYFVRCCLRKNADCSDRLSYPKLVINPCVFKKR